MKFRHVFNPVVHLLDVLLCILNGFYAYVCWLDNDLLSYLNVLHFKDSGVCLVESRFINDSNAEIFLLAVWFWHLKERVDFANCGNVVRDERSKLRVKLNVLRFEARNVFKKFFDIFVNF